MSDVKISQLPASTTPLAGTELVPIVQSGVTKQTTVSAFNDIPLTALAASSGSSLVGYLPSGTGAVATTVQTKLRESVSVLDFGAVGTADDTAVVQAALDSGFGIINFPDATITVTPLTVSSNTTLVFSPNTLLVAKAGYTATQRLLNMSTVSNITIHGNKAIIRMQKASYPTNTDGHGVAMFGGCSNISIYDLTVEDAGGDGFYVNGDNISLVNCISDNANRNGLSIIAGNTINIIGGEYKNTNGTNPQYGIDIEPDYSTEVLQNINLIGVATSGNARGGISFVPYNTTSEVSINVIGGTSTNDGRSWSAGGASALLFALSCPTKVYGTISVENYTIVNGGAGGVKFLDWTVNNPLIRMRNVNVINPGILAIGTNAANNGFVLQATANQGVNQGNIELINCSAIDNRGTALMRVPFFVEGNYMALQDISFINPVASGQTAGFISNVVVAGIVASNVITQYANEFLIQNTATDNVASLYNGATVTNANQASHTVILPLASTCKGLTVTFRLTQAGFIRIVSNALDTILRYVSDAGLSIAGRRIGDQITLRSTGGTAWQVTNTTGEWISFVGDSLFNNAYRVSNGNSGAAPTTGTWVVGDIVYNSIPAAGGTIGWVCTTAGTPGTWKTFGAISA